MVIYELNAEDVAGLIRAHISDDLEYSPELDVIVITSDSDNYHGMIKVFDNGQVILTKEEHDAIVSVAAEKDYTAMFVAVTPEGVFQYNLSLLRLEFEAYTDPESGIDMDVAELDISNGIQILDWYPEFASEDDYIDALMSNGDVIGFDDSL